MNYIFVPSINDKNTLNIPRDELLNYRIAYKQLAEKIISSIINFSIIDEYISNNNYDVPAVSDFDYNFYHKFSSLGSKYMFLRNNIHIERLTADEIKELINNPTRDFFQKTYRKVLFESENNSNTFFGSPRPKTEVKANSLVFEFAYDMKKTNSMNQINQIDALVIEFKKFVEEISQKIGVETSFLEYNAIPDIFLPDNEKIIN